MKEIIYNKLVRDRIPEIIEKSGKQCETEILSDEMYLEMIDKKLDEELAEYHKNQNPEEWANPVQVIYTAAEVREFTVGQLEQIHLWKKAQRGAFRKKLPLMEIRGF